MIAHLQVYGRVQHVGYRYFVMTKARLVGISGIVRNCYDGSVEIYLSGEKENIETMKNICMEGPTFARVDSIDAEYNVSFPDDTSAYYVF